MLNKSSLRNFLHFAISLPQSQFFSVFSYQSGILSKDSLYFSLLLMLLWSSQIVKDMLVL